MLVVFFGLVLLGAPIFVSLIIPSIAYLVLNNITLSSATYMMINSLNQFPLVAVPLFIAVGSLVNELGITQKAFNLARLVYRNKRGYSLKINVLLSLIFSGISGSALADIGGLGHIEIEAAEAEGFSKEFASALTVSTATFGPIFPPSIPLIVYAMVAGVSSVRTLVAGALPAIVLAVLFYIYVSIAAPRKLGQVGQAKSGYDSESSSVWIAFLETLPIIILPIAMVVVMVTGIFSPSELGAAAIAYVIILGFAYRTLTVRKMIRAFISTLRSTAAVLVLLAAASFFASILLQRGLANIVAQSLLSFSTSPILILLFINLILLVVGMFIDGLSIVLLLTPILMPLITALGIDPVHLGVVMVLNTMVGMLTPPFGLGLFAVAEIGRVEVMSVVRESKLIYVIMLIALVLITVFPQISLALPNWAFN